MPSRPDLFADLAYLAPPLRLMSCHRWTAGVSCAPLTRRRDSVAARLGLVSWCHRLTASSLFTAVSAVSRPDIREYMGDVCVCHCVYAIVCCMLLCDNANNV